MKKIKLTSIEKKIVIRKKILNLFLLWFSPTNSIMVFLSKNLDKHIAKYQKILSLQHNKKKCTLNSSKYAVS